MRSMMMPPVGFGPGSQPDAEDGAELAYVPMPSGMQTYAPHIPFEPDRDALAEALPLLGRIRDAAANWRPDQGAVLPLDTLSPAGRRLVDETLGEGEVSIIVNEDPRIEIQETVFSGIWRLRRRDRAGHVVADRVEVGAIPSIVRGRTFQRAAIGAADPALLAHPAIVNAPSIFTEIADRAAQVAPGVPAHVINFTLLPHTPEDLALIEATLGAGPTEILSRGYGNCRISATRWPNCWWVRFYNSMDTLILDTLEIVDVPAVALAAPEDIADSAERIAEVMDAIA